MSVSPPRYFQLRGLGSNQRHPGSEPGVLPLNYPGSTAARKDKGQSTKDKESGAAAQGLVFLSLVLPAKRVVAEAGVEPARPFRDTAF